MMNLAKVVLKYLFALFFIAGGVNHFVSPSFYVKIMPSYLPYHLELVYLSGFFEIILGVGLLIPRLQRLSAFGIILLLIAVFPANLHMYLNSELFPDVSRTILLVRLFIQFLLIYWAFRYTKLTGEQLGLGQTKK